MEECSAIEASIRDLQNRLAAFGIHDDVTSKGAMVKVKSLQNKMRYASLYDRSHDQPPEIRLRRFLCYGDETPLYRPGSRLQPEKMAMQYTMVVPDYLNEVEREGEKLSVTERLKLHTVESLPLFKALDETLGDESRPYPECAIYALAQCARFTPKVPPTDLFKSLAFLLAKKHLKREQDFFLFVKFAVRAEPEPTDICNKLKIAGAGVQANSKVGWGKGMRKFVDHWFCSQDPLELAKRVSRRKGLCGFAYSDLIKICHIKAKVKDGPLAAVYFYILYGLDKTIDKFGSTAGCEEVIAELKKRKSEIEADSADLVALVKSNNLKVDEVRQEKLSVAVWKALVENMSAKEILVSLPRLWRLDAKESADVWKAAADVLSQSNAGADVHPAEVFVAKCDYLKALVNNNKKFDSPFCRSTKNQDSMTEPNTEFVRALDKLMETTLSNCQTDQDAQVLLSVDLRGDHLYNNFPKKCAYAHSVSTLQATALIALCLSRMYKKFTLTALSEGSNDEMEIITVPPSATVESLLTKFSEIKVCSFPTFRTPMRWSKDQKKEVDCFILVTPFLKEWNWSLPASSAFTALREYKEEMKKPDARFALCALGNMAMDVARPPRSNYMMDLAGFDANTIQVLRSFVSGKLSTLTQTAKI